MQMGYHLQKMLDKPGIIHYEIVGFDPRGVGVTTPSAHCFADNNERLLFRRREEASGGHWNTDIASMGYKLSMEEAFSKQCRRIETQGEEIMAYVSTANVARDMVEIIDRLDEYHHGSNTLTPSQSEWKVDIIDDGKMPRLKFIGGSYGTILGNTFASMFPGRVGRMILDGVADADDWVTKQVRLSNFRLRKCSR